MGTKKVRFFFKKFKIQKWYRIIYWEFTSNRTSKTDDGQEQYLLEVNSGDNIHQKEELDAAEALTFLAGNFNKSRWIK